MLKCLAQAEIGLMASIRPHRNLVTFLGVSMDPGQPLCLVTDFVEGGSLESKYQDAAFPIDWVFVLRIAKGVCAGMHHLHEEGLLHRDLAARNILLTSSMEPVVADFGLSKKVDKLHQSSRDNVVQETAFFRGPYKWMAPESLKARASVSCVAFRADLPFLCAGQCLLQKDGCVVVWGDALGGHGALAAL